jgi:hypothetical protein
MGKPDANTVYDKFGSFPKGMNADVDPHLLKRDELAMASNATLRGNFLTNRPPFFDLSIAYGSSFDGRGMFQDATYYKPDSGAEYMVAAIAGRLWKVSPNANSCDVEEVTGSAGPNPSNLQNWLWQSEKWLINNDGISIPRLFDGSSTRRAIQSDVKGATLVGGETIPAVGLSFSAALAKGQNYNGPFHISAQILSQDGLTNYGYVEIISQSNDPSILYPVFLTNQTDAPGTTILAGTPILAYNPRDFTIADVSANVKNGLLAYTITLDKAFNGRFPPSQITFANSEYISVDVISSTQLEFYWPYTPGTPQSPGVGQSVHFVTTDPVLNVGVLATDFIVPPQGTRALASLTSAYTGQPDTVTIGQSQYNIQMPPPTSGILSLINRTMSGDVGGVPLTNMPSNVQIIPLPELPPGRCGAYIMGRNWMSLPDGISFIASDQNGDASGTQAFNFRDASLKVTENTLLAQGGVFSVPSNGGQITFFKGLATLDSSLGQGQVQVGTPNLIFSCNAPQDRSQWQSTTNPILTVSLVTNGGLGQDSAVLSNGDLFFRSIDGIRSLVLARREFMSWGNTPQSQEVSPTLSDDDPALLNFCPGIVFDNRLIMGSSPVQGEFGTYWTSAVVMNFDPISTLQGKAPSIWEGRWTGRNIFKFVSGMFNGVERCFAFTYDVVNERISICELLRSGSVNVDNTADQITWGGESPILLNSRGDADDLLRMTDGEIYLKDVKGAVDITVWFRPDYDQNWHVWRSWTIPVGATYQPRMGLGKPPNASDPTTRRPWCEGYSFQLKFEFIGHCFLFGGRLMAEKVADKSFAPMNPLHAKNAIPVSGGMTGAGGDPMMASNGEILEPADF